MRVGGVAQEEGVAVPELGGDALVDMPCRTGEQFFDLAVAQPFGAAVWISSSMSCWVGTGVPVPPMPRLAPFSWQG